VTIENPPPEYGAGDSGEPQDKARRSPGQVSFKEKAASVLAVHSTFTRDGPADFDDTVGPLHWPKLPADQAEQEWTLLRGWVEQLLERFEHLDHHVVPLCWWRHNGHVEALSALRDLERMCYSEGSPPAGGIEWHRAFRDIESRLREWTANLACGSVHDSRARADRIIDQTTWTEFVTADREHRRSVQGHPDLEGNAPQLPEGETAQ
jgi:hypothetical protein